MIIDESIQPVYRLTRTIRLSGRSPIYTLAIDPSGEVVSVGQRCWQTEDDPQPITRWRIADGAFAGQLDAVGSTFWLRHSANGRWLVASKDAFHLTVYDLFEHRQFNWSSDTDARLTPRIERFSLPTSDWLLLPGERIQLWSLAERELLWEVPSRADPYPVFGPAAAFSSDGEMIAIYGVETSKITLHDARTGERFAALPDAPTGTMQMTFIDHFLVVQATKTMRLYDVRTRTIIRSGEFDERNRLQGRLSLQAHPSQRWIGVGMASGWVDVIRVPDGALLMREPAHRSRIYDLAFTLDGGSMLVTCEDEPIIYIYEQI